MYVQGSSTIFLYFLVLIHLGKSMKVGFLGGFVPEVDANENGRAYITCSFKNRDKVLQTPAWQRDGKTIVLGKNNNDRFYTVLQDGVIDSYNLIIENVERTDGEYKYTCVLLDNEGNIIIESLPTTLKIKQLPGLQYPAFEPLKEKYQAGSQIEITCFTEKTENSVSTLTLYQDGEKLNAYDADDSYQKIKYKFIAQVEDNSKSFRCHLSNSILSEGRNKTTGLLNIQFKPNLRKDEYKVEPDSEQILRIKKPSKANNGSSLTCIVTNDVGSGSSTAVLRVLKQSPPPTILPPATEHPKSPIDELTLAIIIAAAGGCSVLIILIIILPMYYRYLRNCLFQPNIDITGTQIAQPDIYFEPKDSIRPPLPTPDHVEQWRISVGIQVSPESNEHSYTEVGGNSSKGSDIIYGGSINDAATATYRSKSVYV
ncbi:uncharacterized protein [Antedon mediterranea]|uniref:uncharacterized protein n=1 Tax=Antedon mediterranea TaxID=105859 RepID=UPI003AF56E80